MSFKNLHIDEEIINSLKKIGINSPTPVQSKTIPLVLNWCDMVVESNTGTGKTMSFIIPTIKKYLDGIVNNSIILVPTRELVNQIYDEVDKVIKNIIIEDNSHSSNIDEINLVSVYGGKDINKQINKLKNSNKTIIIATPGRLIDHINRKTIDISNTDVLVIDEADQMILMGFRNEVDFIVSKIKSKRQTLLFSATIDSKIKKMAYRYSDKLDFISIGNDEIPDTIEQEFIFTTDRKKFDDFIDTIKKEPPFMAIIFCRTKARADALELKLSNAGFDCEKIHSDLSQSKREKIMKDFRNLKIQFLISTDISSRGIDVEGITHIYNYDFPERAEDYIHRIGRTGRLGKKGKSYSFVTDKNMEVYDKVKELIK